MCRTSWQSASADPVKPVWEVCTNKPLFRDYARPVSGPPNIDLRWEKSQSLCDTDNWSSFILASNVIHTKNTNRSFIPVDSRCEMLNDFVQLNRPMNMSLLDWVEMNRQRLGMHQTLKRDWLYSNCWKGQSCFTVGLVDILLLLKSRYIWCSGYKF